jgi:peptidoglycan/LPS O-acetylase OafA/YrhL
MDSEIRVSEIRVPDVRALTGVRGIAAILIVLYHFGSVQLFDGGRLDYIPIQDGYLAVDLFFMLSGYVIALNYHDAFKTDAVRNFVIFMVKRVARLYPAYLAIACLYAAKIAAGLSGSATLAQFSIHDIVGNLAMATGWGLHVNPLIGVSWAASAEMGSYLLVPLLFAATLTRNPLAAILVLLLALGAVYGISVSGRGAAGPLDVTSGDSLLPLVRAIAGFTTGIVIYRFADRIDRLSGAAQDVLLAVVIVGILATTTTIQNDLPLYLLFIPLVAVLSRDGRLAQLLFANRPAYYFGLISYSVFLIHPLLVSFAVQGWRSFGQTREAYLLSTAACLGVVWMLAELSYRFIEMPGRRRLTELLLPARRNTQAAPTFRQDAT